MSCLEKGGKGEKGKSMRLLEILKLGRASDWFWEVLGTLDAHFYYAAECHLKIISCGTVPCGTAPNVLQ